MNLVGYLRYSTDNNQDASIAMQLRMITEWCERNGHRLVDVKKDEAMSGTNMDRFGFTEALRVVALPGCDGIVFYNMSRASRDVVDWFSFRERMRALGKAVFSATEQLGDISDPSAFLMEGVTAVVGHHQVLQTRKASIDGKRTRAQKGLFCGGNAPLGYDIVDARYVVNEFEAQAVRTIYDMYAAGCSYAEIIARLNERGHRTKRGQPFGKNSLHDLLRNQRYTGVYIWFADEVRYMRKPVGKPHPDPVVIDSAIPRIIDDMTWRAVQKRMEENKKNKLNNSRLNRQYLLSGLLYCTECGGAYAGHTSTVKKRDGSSYEYAGYLCANKSRLHNCTSRKIPCVELDTLVRGLVRDSILSGELIEKTADAIMDTVRAHAGRDNSDIQKEIARLEAAKANVFKALELTDDPDVRQDIIDRMGEHTARIKVLREQLADNPVMPEISRDDLIAQLRIDSARVLENEMPSRELIQKYIARIDIGKETITIHAVADLAGTNTLYALPGTQKSAHNPDNPSCRRDWLLR